MSKLLFCMGSWRINSSAWAVVEKVFRKCKEDNIKEGTNILRSYIYLYLFSGSFLGELQIITDSWMWKSFLYLGSGKIFSWA